MGRAGEIQYLGLPGVSKFCVRAVMKLIQFGDKISKARLLSSSNAHCFLLTVNEHETVAIKSGFSSGYGGEGPRALATVLQLLNDCGADIEEYDVSQGVLDRLDNSSLTSADIARIEALRPVLPTRWYDYLFDDDRGERRVAAWRNIPPAIPYSIIDPRIMDLALTFFDGPDEKLLKGYRRLEDIVRGRVGSEEHGQGLFAQAFNVNKARLTWPETSASERQGRASLFVGAYAAYRNPRAHQEREEDERGYLGEFLLLNHLYLLEAQAEAVDVAQ